MKNQEIKKWMEENLVDKKGAKEITGQTDRAFRQSVDTKKIIPFFEIPGSTSSNIRLYLKSDLEEYNRIKKK